MVPPQNVYNISEDAALPFIMATEDDEAIYEFVDQSHLQLKHFPLKQEIIKFCDENELPQFSESDPACHNIAKLQVKGSQDPITPQLIIKYLANREAHDCIIMLFYPKAGPKSYGKMKDEKR